MGNPAQFQPGCAPGPGRPKGSVGGRARAIALIDEILTENAEDLRVALLKEFQKSPVRFWQRFGFPLVPQALVARVENDNTPGPWVSLLELMRLRDIEAQAQAAGLRLPPPAKRPGALCPPGGDVAGAPFATQNAVGGRG